MLTKIQEDYSSVKNFQEARSKNTNFESHHSHSKHVESAETSQIPGFRFPGTFSICRAHVLVAQSNIPNLKGKTVIFLDSSAVINISLRKHFAWRRFLEDDESKDFVFICTETMNSEVQNQIENDRITFVCLLK